MPESTPEPLLCIRCKYDLRSQPGDGVCPECGAPVMHSRIGTVAAEHLELESRMLAKEHLYRRNRGGSIFLAVGSALGFITFIFVFGLVGADPRQGGGEMESHDAAAWTTMATLGHAVFWTAMAFLFHARILHCRSIRYYRSREGRGDNPSAQDTKTSGSVRV